MADLPDLITCVFIFSLGLTNSEGQNLTLTINPNGSFSANVICNVINISDTVTFTQTWHGQIIRNEPRNINGNQSTLWLSPVTLQDAGYYQCIGNNTESNKVILFERVAPRLTSTPMTVVYVDVGRLITLSATFINASELTKVVWTKDGIPVMENGQTDTRETGYRLYGKDVNISRTEVSLNWTVTSLDFRCFDVTACTEGGCSSSTTELKSFVPPLPPTEFRVVDNLTDGFWFTWRSEVNAAGHEMFQLAYKRSDTRDDWYIKEVLENTGPEVLVYTRISGLAVDTGYDVRVRSVYTRDKNKVSNYTDKLQVFVKGPVPDTDLGVGVGIVIGLCVAVFVGALLCLIIFLLRRKKYLSQSKQQKNSSSSTDDNYSKKTQMSNMSTMSSNPYESSPQKESPPNLPAFPVPSSRPSRAALPRPPIPGDSRITSQGPPETSAPCPPVPKSTHRKKGPDSCHPPLPLPSQVHEEEVYEPVEGSESGQEYVDPMMAYQNM